MDYDAVGGILGIEDTYQSNFDYKSFEVEPEAIDKLIRFEQDIKNHQKKTLDSIFSMSKILYNARTLLANNKSGTFGAWHESLGLNREAVSVMLKRYDLYLQTKDKTVMELPVRAVKVITKAESKFSKDQIKEIISADKPLSKIQDIVRLSDNIIYFFKRFFCLYYLFDLLSRKFTFYFSNCLNCSNRQLHYISIFSL